MHDECPCPCDPARVAAAWSQRGLANVAGGGTGGGGAGAGIPRWRRGPASAPARPACSAPSPLCRRCRRRRRRRRRRHCRRRRARLRRVRERRLAGARSGRRRYGRLIPLRCSGRGGKGLCGGSRWWADPCRSRRCRHPPAHSLIHASPPYFSQAHSLTHSYPHSLTHLPSLTIAPPLVTGSPSLLHSPRGCVGLYLMSVCGMPSNHPCISVTMVGANRRTSVFVRACSACLWGELSWRGLAGCNQALATAPPSRTNGPYSDYGSHGGGVGGERRACCPAPVAVRELRPDQPCCRPLVAAARRRHRCWIGAVVWVGPRPRAEAQVGSGRCVHPRFAAPGLAGPGIRPIVRETESESRGKSIRVIRLCTKEEQGRPGQRTVRINRARVRARHARVDLEPGPVHPSWTRSCRRGHVRAAIRVGVLTDQWPSGHGS
jgi:hypothetical protein